MTNNITISSSRLVDGVLGFTVAVEGGVPVESFDLSFGFDSSKVGAISVSGMTSGWTVVGNTVAGEFLVGGYSIAPLNNGALFTVSVTLASPTEAGLVLSMGGVFNEPALVLADQQLSLSNGSVKIWSADNDAPILSKPLPDQSVSSGANLNVALPAGSFTDVDSATLTYSATLSDGNPLPSWLSFNPVTQTFSGTPNAADAGQLSITVKATDSDQASASDTFDLAIRAVQQVNGNNSNDQLKVGVGSAKVNAGAGVDTVALPLFPNEFKLSETAPGQVQGLFGDGNTLELIGVEFLEFGSSDNKTKIALGDLISGFAQDQLATLTDLYLAFFGRAPDAGGLEYWQRQLLDVDLKGQNKNKDFVQIAKDFAWSDEAQKLFPLDANNRDFVQIVYKNCFDRNPDPGGWDYWTGKLNGLGKTDLSDRGAFVAEVILGAYAPSSGPEDRNLLTNKHDVAMYYVNQLSLKPQEGYDSSINDLLADLSMDPATAQKAMNVIDYAFNDLVDLTGIMTNPALLGSLWG